MIQQALSDPTLQIQTIVAGTGKDGDPKLRNGKAFQGLEIN